MASISPIIPARGIATALIVPDPVRRPSDSVEALVSRSLRDIAALPRPALSRLIARLIDRLDEIDGDPDIEDDSEDQCLAGDDGCGPVLRHGNIVWGADEDQAYSPVMPAYGIDQSSGPINYRDAAYSSQRQILSVWA